MKTMELEQWISLREDDRHDFKCQWYSKHEKSELVKDIFSFVNTMHEDNCYLIIGVTDDQEVVGIENDESRLNQQQLLDFVKKLPIAANYIPELKLETFCIQQHQIDVITVYETKNVPCYLTQLWPNKRSNGESIYPGQIFVRVGDTNTGHDSTANFNYATQLWQKHFRMNSPIADRFTYTLSDVHHWDYAETDQIGFQYSLNPDFFILIENDSLEPNRLKYMPYSINQIRTKMDWSILKVRFRQLTISEFQIASFDSANFMCVTPDVTSIYNRDLFYYYFIEGSLKYAIQKMIEKSGSSISPDSGSLSSFYKGVARYNSVEEKDSVELELANNYNLIKDAIEPSQETIKQLRDKLEFDFGKDNQEVTDLSIRETLRQFRMGVIANKFINVYRGLEEYPVIDKNYFNRI